MLRLEPGLLASDPDPRELNRAAQRHRQRKRGPEDLAAAFAVRGVEDELTITHPRTSARSALDMEPGG
jgi:hypothetical protein